MDSPTKYPLLSSDDEEKDKPYVRRINKNYICSKFPTKISYRICLVVNFIFILIIIMHFIYKFNSTASKKNSVKKIDPDIKNIFTNFQIRKVKKTFKWKMEDELEDEKFYASVQKVLKCNSRDYKTEILQRGNFWVLKNYIKAEHGPLKCHETVTYTTHGDYTFLDNIVPLLNRWKAPVSIALYAPGTDFEATIASIDYLRNCLPDSSLVRQYATFHIYFGSKHIPKIVASFDDKMDTSNFTQNCTTEEPYLKVNITDLYKTKNKLLYPINVARNIARDAALTHFVLASDIELYPTPGLPRKFLEMILGLNPRVYSNKPRVYPLALYEVAKSVKVPDTKTQLKRLIENLEAIRFHRAICPSCHKIPRAAEWEEANETKGLNVFVVAKRTSNWEPIYIGTHAEPHYDERLSWEGKSDKMTQGYAMCVLDYEFFVLDNAFLVHKPGIKASSIDKKRRVQEIATRTLIKTTILPELKILYGSNDNCEV